MYKVFRLNEGKKDQTALGYAYVIQGASRILGKRYSEKDGAVETYYDYSVESWYICKNKNVGYEWTGNQDEFDEELVCGVYSYIGTFDDLNKAIHMCIDEINGCLLCPACDKDQKGD